MIDPAYCRKKVLHRGLVSLVKSASEDPKLLGGGSNFLRWSATHGDGCPQCGSLAGNGETPA